jgi:hypothetical protein
MVGSANRRSVAMCVNERDSHLFSGQFLGQGYDRYKGGSEQFLFSHLTKAPSLSYQSKS